MNDSDSYNPIMIHSWPRAIMHIDADAFFASCEQAIHPELKGKPVITGKERGIVAAASYEAKNRGVERGMRLFEAKKVCPDVIMLPSDYETYSLFSVRMFEILRRFSPVVEEYSIDEAFVDLTGLRRLYHSSYKDIAFKIQEEVEKELGITVSVGYSLQDTGGGREGAWHHGIGRGEPDEGACQGRVKTQKAPRPHHDTGAQHTYLSRGPSGRQGMGHRAEHDRAA